MPNSVIRIARDLGIEVREQTFTRDELWCADEVFMCGTAAEVTPVREIDHRQIGAHRAFEAHSRKPFTTRSSGRHSSRKLSWP